MIHIDQAGTTESRRTEVKWADVQRVKVAGNKEGKLSDGGRSSDAVAEVETAVQNNLSGQCVCVCVYASVHECRGET